MKNNFTTQNKVSKIYRNFEFKAWYVFLRSLNKNTLNSLNNLRLNKKASIIKVFTTNKLLKTKN